MFDAPICEHLPAILLEDFEGAVSAPAAAITRDPNYTLDNGTLRAAFVGNDVGTERNSSMIDLPGGETYSLSFDLKFADGFPFVRGGKLPGFAPAAPVWGGMDSAPDSWSSRIMWRRSGRPVVYVYHQNRQGKWGDDGAPVHDAVFVPGRWQAVTLQLALNTEGNTGHTAVFVDGKKINEMMGLSFRDAPSDASAIRRLAFQTFHGGNSPAWAPRGPDGAYTTVYAWFDNLAVHDGLCARPEPKAAIRGRPMP